MKQAALELRCDDSQCVSGIVEWTEAAPRDGTYVCLRYDAVSQTRIQPSLDAWVALYGNPIHVERVISRDRDVVVWKARRK